MELLPTTQSGDLARRILHQNSTLHSLVQVIDNKWDSEARVGWVVDYLITPGNRNAR
jgi:hypothetical protein